METSFTGRFLEILTSKTWNLKRTQEWMDEWMPISCMVAAVYLLIVYGCKKLMQKRKAFELDTPLAIWNLSLAIFSLCGTFRTLPELIWAVNNLGIVGSICENAELFTDPYTGYWIWLYAISKAPELFDTMFLVLRKRPLTFLHCYHHAVTFLIAQFINPKLQALVRWAVSLNFMVHTVMYLYFFLRAIKVRTPRIIAKFVTTIQIVQFFIGCFLSGLFLLMKVTGTVPPNCACDFVVWSIGIPITLSYLCLFTHFFHQTYIATKKHTNMASKSDKEA